MFSSIRKRTFTPAGALAVIALVFAMAGGAYATGHSGRATASKAKSKGLTKAQVLALIKANPSPAGPQGPPGTAGTNGTSGKEGPEGKQGPKGDPGQNGTVGFTKTLPPGETETGYWAWGQTGPPYGGIARNSAYVSISFPIPLENPLTEGNAYIVGVGGNGGTCPGSVQKPEAEPGSLCVYVNAAGTAENQLVFGLDSGESEGTGTSGAMLVFAGIEEGGSGTGDWAVTAPTGP